MIDKEIDKALKHLSTQDPIISTIIKNYPKCNLKPKRKYFNSLVRAIIGQQLSILAADAIWNKFNNYFDKKPSPEKILETDYDTLRSLGLSNAKVKYVTDLSEKVLNKEVKLRGFTKMTDEEIIAELTKVKGIGVWTVHMFMMFNLGRLNVLATGDLGIKKAIMLNYGTETLPTEEDVTKVSGKYNWHPYNTVACWYMWASLDEKVEF